MANILSTPDAVVASIWACFPEAEITTLVTPAEGFSLECTLVTDSRSFRVSKVLDAHTFNAALQKLIERVNYCRAFQRPMAEIHLDVERFSNVPPLEKWKPFQREIFRKKGIECDKLLEDYLSSNDASAAGQLMQLGLAPVQLATHCSEEDLQIFLNLFDRLEKAKNKEIDRLFTGLETNYPAVFSAVVEKIREQKFARVDGATSPYQTILKKLISRVIGQDQAAEFLATSLASQNNQDGNQRFLFVGPTGVGKTEMAKAAASIKKNRFLMFRMEQYMDDSSMNNLFGAPVGYVGAVGKPRFAQEVEGLNPVRRPSERNVQVYEIANAVILFDELEKAHLQVKQSLLTLLDEGYCSIQYTVGRGREDHGATVLEKYVFKKSILIGTSNLYSRNIVAFFREGRTLQQIGDEFVRLNSASPTRESFSPEFLGKFRKVVPFGPIPRGAAYQAILQLKINVQLPLLQKSFQCQEVRIENTSQILEILERMLYGEGYDIRRIETFFETNVSNVINNRIVSQTSIDLSKASIVIVSHEGQLRVKVTGIIYGKAIDLTESFPVTA